jgi:hypothetical protein
MRLFSPGETFPPARFGISGATGAATNADATPTLAVYRNGVLDSGVGVTVLNPATGEYSFTFVIPGGYALGDVVSVRATATVAGIVLAPQEIVSFRLDSKVSTRSVAGDAMALTGGERTTLYAGIWAVGTRTLTAISDSAGVTTLLSRLTSTRAAYLDALTALTEGRMVWLERLGTALEETSTGSGIWRLTTLALSRLGFDVSAIRVKTDALPADPASNTQVNTRLATSGYTAPDNAGISTAAASAATAATSAASADSKLTTGRLTNLDAATPTRLGILDRLAGMMEQVTGLWRWTANTQSQSPVTPAAPTAEQVAAEVIAQAIFSQTAGLTGLNQVCRDFTYDESDNLTSFRIRVYDSPIHAQSDDPEVGLLSSFIVNNVLNGQGQVTKTTTKVEV